MKTITQWLCGVLLCLVGGWPALQADTLTLSLQNTDIRDAMLMLSKQERLNIFVAEGVDGDVSVNIYNMETMEAIHAIAQSAGFGVEQHANNIYIINKEDAGKYRRSDLTQIRAFKLQYITTTDIEPILEEHLSGYGSIKSVASNNMIVVEDKPAFLVKIEQLLGEIDREPQQILIEAKILEINLTDTQSFGLDWSKLFQSNDGSGTFGTQGLSNPTSTGLFAQYSNSNVELVLNALKERGRLRTLSTPKLLAMEGHEAETVVGTRIGFKVTTTVNQVTSETIEFLETGIILKVTPSVDRNGRILLDIHPEVSAGSVSDDGVPSKSTTQVSTRMLVPNGKTVFMGGLIRRSVSNSREGVPVIGDLPLVGGLFANDSSNISTSEIIVLLTPRIIDFEQEAVHAEALLKVEMLDKLLGVEQETVETDFDEIFDEGYDF